MHVQLNVIVVFKILHDLRQLLYIAVDVCVCYFLMSG